MCWREFLFNDLRKILNLTAMELFKNKDSRVFFLLYDNKFLHLKLNYFNHRNTVKNFSFII